MFRHLNPVGILRVEQELVRAFEDLNRDDVIFGIFDENLNGYVPLARDDVDHLIRLKTWKTQGQKRVAPAGRFTNLGRRLQFLRRLARSLWQSRTTGTDNTRWREQYLAEALLQISGPDFNRVRGQLDRITNRFPKYRAYLPRLDDLNWQVETGHFDYGAHGRHTAAVGIDPETITHFVCAGAFWSDARHQYAHHAKYAHGWKIHYMIYDLIPIKWRHVTEPTTKETFPLALHWALWSVDQIWTISQTTKADLKEYITTNGYPEIADDAMTTTYLGAEINTKKASPAAVKKTLGRFGLKAENFVLMVGTLEPRKNHEFAYRMWKELNARHPGQIPPLVWVGQPGWSIGPLLAQIGDDAELPHQAIHILSDVSDEELSILYRQCRFSLFPSHYEGWGLPVVEALNYGRPVVASDTAAVVEAGQGASDHIGLFDGEAWLSHVYDLISDDALYQQTMDRVAGFDGYRWQDFRTQIQTGFTTFEAQYAGPKA